MISQEDEILPCSKEITAKQRRAIPLVISELSIEEGCKSASISAKTWYAWLRQEEFKREVDRHREMVVLKSLDRLKAAVKNTVDGLANLADAEEKNVRLRALWHVLNYFLKAKEFENMAARGQVVRKDRARKGG